MIGEGYLEGCSQGLWCKSVTTVKNGFVVNMIFRTCVSTELKNIQHEISTSTFRAFYHSPVELPYFN